VGSPSPPKVGRPRRLAPVAACWITWIVTTSAAWRARASNPVQWPLLADSVAKVFLRHGSQILRGVGAAIEQRCGGPRRHTPNSQAILAAGLRLYRAAIVPCFVLWRGFSSCGFWHFCNTIGTERTWRDVRLESAFGGIADVNCSQRVFRLLTHNRPWDVSLMPGIEGETEEIEPSGRYLDLGLG
jgi:hypothetical protein